MKNMWYNKEGTLQNMPFHRRNAARYKVCAVSAQPDIPSEQGI